MILVTGKGGVGRTTVAAALAMRAAEAGHRVLLAEIEEPAHIESSPLARIFGEHTFDDRPRELRPGIDAVLLRTERGTELFLTSVFRVRALARLALRTPALLRFLHAAPSLHEMGIFNHVLSLAERQEASGRPRYDMTIIDMPATGHTLALTGLPRVLLRLVARGPIAERLRQGQALFNDPARAAACVVTLAEPLPVSEALELMEGLEETGVAVGAVLVNRVPADPFTDEERAALTDLLAGGPVRGSVELERIARARESLDRLRVAVRVPVIVVPEHPDDGETAEAVARGLAPEAP